jgi:hypothetical protein
MASMDARAVERTAYRSRWDDGLFDLYLGLSLVWMGVAWLWFDAIAGIAGVFPAIFVGPFVAFRTRFIEDRSGYVRFSEERRRWERRNLVGFLVLGLGGLIVAMAFLVTAGGGSGVTDAIDRIAPGLIAFIIAAMVGVVAVASMLPRLFGYTFVLVLGGVLAAIYDTNPGLPLLAAGVVVSAVGTWLVWRFVHTHPRRADEGGRLPA